MEFALNFLKSNAGIDSPALLSSPFLLVTLGYYGHKRNYQIGAEESQRLRYWVLVANAKGRYSRGSSETLLDQDLATLRQGGGANELIDRLRLQVGRLDVAPEELEGRNQRSALFKTMFLAFRAAGAKDWRSNLAIALDHSGFTPSPAVPPHLSQGRAQEPRTPAREADDIANLAFIGGKTNRQISDKATEPVLPALDREIGRRRFRGAVHSDSTVVAWRRKVQGVPARASGRDSEAAKRFPCGVTVAVAAVESGWRVA